MQKSKSSLLLVVGVFIIVATLLFLRERGEEQLLPNKKEITVTIDYGDGIRRQFRGNGIKFMQNENAWSVLQRAAASASIPLEVARGFYPVVINGKRNGEEGKRWVLYVNEERQSNGASLEIIVKEGDEVIWKFE